MSPRNAHAEVLIRSLSHGIREETLHEPRTEAQREKLSKLLYMLRKTLREYPQHAGEAILCGVPAQVSAALLFGETRFDGFLAHTACEVLLECVRLPEHLDKIVEYGDVLRACALIVREHTTNAVGPAIALLSGALVPRHLEAAGQAGVVEALLSCLPDMPSPKDNEYALSAGAKVLRAALSCDANVARCRAAGGMNIVLETRQKHLLTTPPALAAVFGDLVKLLE